MNPDTIAAAYVHWSTGSPLEAGRLIYEQIPDVRRPPWAAAILDLCRPLIPPVPEIDAVREIAADSRRWKDAHAAFRLVRRLTLEAEGTESATAVYRGVLYVTENAAKVIYNASGEAAPFDEDSGWWLVSSLRHVVDGIGGRSFEAQAWAVVSSFGSRAA